MTMRNRFVLAVLLCSLGVPHAGRAQTLADPAHFSVKRTYAGSTIGVPQELGGALFSPDGNTLYLVGSADRATSAVYAVPVIRDSGTQEIIDLGPSAAVTKAFDSASFSGELDAGLDV